MASPSAPVNPVWPLPFGPEDWEHTPPAVQAYVHTLHYERKYSVNPFRQGRQALSHHHCGASDQVMRSCKT